MPLAIPKIRDDLVYSRDSEHDDYWFVKCPVRNDFFRFNQLQHTLMLSLDGKNTTDDLIEIIGEEWEVEMGPQEVERFVERLSDRLLLDISAYEADDDVTKREIRRRLKKSGFQFRLPRRNLDSPEAQLFAQGMQHALSENPLQAASYFRAVLELNPGNERARLVLQCIHEAFLHVRRSDMPFGAKAYSLFNPDKLLGTIDRHLGRFIYSWLGVVLIVVLTFAQIPLFISLVGSPDFQLSSFDVFDLITFFLTPILWLFIHEMGHALSCRHYGGRPNEIGFMLMFGILPAAYCDTSDTYLFKNNRHKIICFLSGIPAQTVTMTLLLTLCFVLNPDVPGWTGIVLGTMIGLNAVYLNLIPFLPFDGYFALGDYLKIMNLRERSFAYVWAVLGKALLGVDTRAEADASPRERRILFIFGSLAMLYTVVYLVGIMINWLLPLLIEYLGIIGLLIVVRYVYSQVKNLTLLLLVPGTRFILRERKQVFTVPRCIGYVVVLGGVVWVLSLQGRVHVDGDMVIEPMRIASIAVREPGLVAEVHVKEGQYVEEGQVLVTLRSDPLQLELARQTKNVALANTRLSMLESGARKEEIELALAKHKSKRVFTAVMSGRLRQAREVRRMEVSSDSDVAEARQRVVSASGQGKLADLEVEMLLAGTRLEEIEQAKANVRRGEALVEALEQRISRLKVKTPIAGRVTTRDMQLLRGRWMAAEEAICQVQDESAWRARITPHYGEPIAGVFPGSEIRMRTNSYPHEETSLTVGKILPPASGDGSSSAVFESNAFEGDKWRAGMSGHARVYGPKRSLVFRYLALPLIQALDVKVLTVLYDT